MSLAAEMALAAMLGSHGTRIFEGLTTIAERKERARGGILRAGLKDRIAGPRNPKSETFGQYFERVYREPLVVQSFTEAA